MYAEQGWAINCNTVPYRYFFKTTVTLLRFPSDWFPFQTVFYTTSGNDRVTEFQHTPRQYRRFCRCRTHTGIGANSLLFWCTDWFIRVRWELKLKDSFKDQAFPIQSLVDSTRLAGYCDESWAWHRPKFQGPARLLGKKIRPTLAGYKN